MARSQGPVARMEAAAGGAGGSWYVLLEGIARLVGERHPGIELVVIEGGGVMNHAGVGEGRPPVAILNPPMTAAALAGRPPFDRASPDLRVGIANLTVNHLQLAVDGELGLETLADWPARRLPLRIPVDRPGTVDRLVFDLALEHVGLAPADLERWGGRLVPAANYHAQLDLYRRREVDALWQFMAIPSPSIAAAHADRPVRFASLPAGLIRRLAAGGWAPAEIPAGAYGVVAAPVPTVAMGTSLGFHAGVPEAVVYAIVEAVCEAPDGVARIHPAAAHFDPARAAENPGGPLHAGAERYYRSRGIL